MHDKPAQIDVQNALRVLTRVAKPDDAIFFTGGDLIVFRGEICRMQEVAELLVPKT